MAGVRRIRRWAGLAAAVLPLVLGGTSALASPQPTQVPTHPRCGVHASAYRSYPWQIERLLHLLADGVESRRECRLIRHPHRRDHGLRPWGGRRMGAEERAAPGAVPLGRCPAGHFRIACVDQNRQLVWVQQGHRVVFGPVRARTGAPWHPTRNGMHRVYRRSRDQISTLYGDPMPYSQFFDRGEAFHGVRSRLRASSGSYGCVNLRMSDARRLWSVLHVGDRVYVWGRKPRR